MLDSPESIQPLADSLVAIDFNARRVWHENEEVPLLPTEYNVFEVLAQQPDTYLSAKYIGSKALQLSNVHAANTVRVHISKIRPKFGELGDIKAGLIRTKQRAGFKVVSFLNPTCPSGDRPGVYSLDNNRVVIDSKGWDVWCNQKLTDLTASQFLFLVTLAKNPGVIQSWSKLQAVTGSKSRRSLHALKSQLSSKLGPDCSELMVTDPDVGVMAMP